MEGGPMIQRSFTIAQVPRPLDSQSGKTLTADTHNLINGRKRKRSELVVAVDGESLNIYDVKTNKPISSYAVPPQSFFECPPCSIRQKSEHSTSAKRVTYCALRTPELEIFRFAEGQGNSTSTSKKTLKPRPGKTTGVDDGIAIIDVIATPGADEPSKEDDIDLLCVYKDGEIQRMSGDLQQIRWSTSLFSIISQQVNDTDSVTVKAVFLVDIDLARQSILKKREDIVASLTGGIDPQEFNDHEVLVMVSKPQRRQSEQSSDLSVHIFAIPKSLRSDKRFFGTEIKVVHLISKIIPQPHSTRNFENESHFNFHSSTGSLQFCLESSVLTYDLCEHVPKLSSILHIGPVESISYLRTSGASILASTSDAVGLYNLQYQSVQASLPLSELLPKQPKKGRSPPQVRLLSFYSKMNVAVALSGHALLGLPVNLKRTKHRSEGLLIESIGRGIPIPDQEEDTKLPVDSSLDEPFKLIFQPFKQGAKTMDELDSLVASGQIRDFEERMADALYSSTGKIGKKRKREEEEINVGLLLRTKDTKDPSANRMERLRVPSATDNVDRELLLYLLGKIFSWDTLNSQLSIIFCPPRLFRWLIVTRRLSISNIELALQKNTSPVSSTLPSGSLIRSIIRFDSSLDTLILVIKHSTLFSTDEIVQIVKALLEFDHPENLNEPLFVTNGSHDESLTKPVELLSGSNSNADLVPAKTSSLPTITTALNLTLSTLHGHHPSQAITKSLRANLTKSETLTVVHHLRMCLASGGWTSRFTDHYSSPIQHSDTPDEAPPSLNFPIIVNLLNCAIDAVGPLGFLSSTLPHSRIQPRQINSPSDSSNMDLDLDNSRPGLSEQQQEDNDLIPFMKAEVSAALTGIEECSYLRGILREFLRYSSSCKPLHSSSQSAAPSFHPQITDPTSLSHPGSTMTTFPKKIIKQGRGEIHTLISSSRQHGVERDDEQGLLPLSLKAEESDRDIKNKVASRGGGGVKARTARDIGELHNMRVGEYSFERIVI